MTLTGLTWIVVAIVVVGLGLVGAGVYGIVQHRRSQPVSAPPARRPAAGRPSRQRSPYGNDEDDYDEPWQDDYPRNRGGAVTQTWVPGGGDPMNDETAVLPKIVDDDPPPRSRHSRY
jgi:hypothetical protein